MSKGLSWTSNKPCPNGGTLSGTTCTVNTLSCPTGYTEHNTTHCKKTISTPVPEHCEPNYTEYTKDTTKCIKK